MADWREQINEAMVDFETVADLARSPILRNEIIVGFYDARRDADWVKIGRVILKRRA